MAGARTAVLRLTSPVLLDRDDELAVAARAVARPPALVLVEGEAGVGKTRLLQELAAGASRARMRPLVGHCVPLHAPFPYGPVVEALTMLAPVDRPLPAVTGVLHQLLPELAGWLPAPPPPTGDPRIDRHRVFRAVRELLAAAGPVVLILDDLHWMDAGSLELLRFLVPVLPARVSVVLSSRLDGDRDPGLADRIAVRPPAGAGYARVRLEPLTVAAVGRLAAAILRTERVADDFAACLHERTGGLPFAVEEVLSLLPERQLAGGVDARRACRMLAGLGVPGPVGRPIRERLARLSGPARRLVLAAAVLDVPVGESILAAVAGLDFRHSEAVLAEALGQALLVSRGPDRYAFRHALGRQAVYDTLPAPARRRLHARAEQVLRAAAPPPRAQLAHHARAAGRPVAARRHAEAAADEAAARGDTGIATELLREVLDAPDLPRATRLRLTGKLARAAALCVDHADAIRILGGALADRRLPAPARGELRITLGLLLSNQAGDVAGGTEQLRRSVLELAARPQLRARALAALALPDHTDGPVAENLRFLAAALRLLPQVTEPALRTAVLVNRATTLLTMGDPAAWEAIARLPERGRCAAETQQLHRGACNLVNNCVQLGHYAQAHRFLAWSRSLVADSVAEYPRLLAGMNEMELRWATGDLTGVPAQARQLAGTVDVPALRRAGTIMLGIIAFRHGRVAEAVARLRSARVEAHLMPWNRGDAYTVSWLALALLAAGRPKEARAEVAAALRVIEVKSVWVWAVELAPTAVETLIATGDPVAAAELAEDFTTGVRGRDTPLGAAAAAWCRARVREAAGRHREASREYLSARAAYADLPRPYDAARAAEAAAGCLAADPGRPAGPEVAAWLTEALAAYERLDAPVDARRCRQALRQAGGSPPRRPGRPGYGRDLSPREIEVLGLLARDRTNREIAAELFLSERTVEGHLARLRAKLGAVSRRELRTLAAADRPAG